MGFYRIIKKTIKFILYQMPKKWLIMIIFALLMTFGLTKVKAVDYIDAQDIMQENVEFYEYLDIGDTTFDTGICPCLENSSADNRLIFLDYYNNFVRWGQLFSINEETNNNSYPIDTNENGIKLEYNSSNSGNNAWFRCNRTWNTQYSFPLTFETDQTLFLDFVHKTASIGESTYDFSSYIQGDFYTRKTMLLNSNAQMHSSVYRIYNLSVYIYAHSNGLTIPVLINNYYACKYTNAIQDIIYGFYDTVNGDILVFARNPATPPLLRRRNRKSYYS